MGQAPGARLRAGAGREGGRRLLLRHRARRGLKPRGRRLRPSPTSGALRNSRDLPQARTLPLMWGYVLKRTGAALATLVAASVIIFIFIHLIPGDPVFVMLGDSATPEQVATLRTRLGLDEPLVVQYFYWAGSALQGDLGRSIFFDAAGDRGDRRRRRDKPPARHHHDGVGRPDRRAGRRHRRGEARHWLDQSAVGRRDAAGLDPDLLGRPLSHPRLRGAARLAAVLRLPVDLRGRAGCRTCATSSCRASRSRRPTRR